MDIVTSNYMPGDPRLIDQIVYELKSQGIFDQFRKECIADVDTKPAYQNLSQRVEGSVMNFLKKQKFSEDMNKNQLREQLRKSISESGFLETGVERIVDQVVNPKINTVFLPKVEDVVYRFLGIEKPNQEIKLEEKTDVVDLLPNDLEAISPESVHEHSLNSNTEKKDESFETNSLNSSNTKTEDESPPFELLEENTKFSMQEENSVDSHLSGISGLASHESVLNTEIKDVLPMDISQDNSQNSLNSEGNLSIVTSEEDTKMEICEDSNLSENKYPKKENNSEKDSEELAENKIQEKEIKIDQTDAKEKVSEKIEDKTQEVKHLNEIKIEDKKETEGKRIEDKKTNENRTESKKSHNRHKSSKSDKDKKDEKGKKNRSKSESKSKDHKDSKSGSKHSSSSKDKDKDKDKKDKTGKDKDEVSDKDKQVKKEDKERDKSKDKSSKSKEKEKSDKERDKSDKDKLVREKEKLDKEKTYKDKSVKDRSNREKPRSEKSKLDRDKDKLDKDKLDKDKDKSDKENPEKEKSNSNKHSKERSSSSSKKEVSSKEKDKGDEKVPRDKSSSSKEKISSSSKRKESSSRDKDSSKSSKDRSKSSSSSTKDKERDKERKAGGDTKSRSSDKHKKNDKDKSLHHDKSSSSIKKDKDKKIIDDHYSLKDKKSERRSTDRDSNDGSSKMSSRNGSFTDSFSQSFKESSKGSSEVFSSGSGDSSNSDKMEGNLTEGGTNDGGVDLIKVEAPQTIKYIKPKFASNIHEAMKIMKIRKQLAKLERQNQLSLAHVRAVKDSQEESQLKAQQHLKELSVVLEKSTIQSYLSDSKVDVSNTEKIKSSIENKFDKEEQTVLSEKQQIKTKESDLPTEISIAEKEARKKETQNIKEPITEELPILRSQDLSMESFEALEARLAQEMSNVNYHMYGEEDDIYDYDSICLSPVKKRKASVEHKPSLKKVLFDTSSANNDNDKEIELVVNNQVATEESNIGSNDENTPIIISDPQPDTHYDETVFSDQIEVLNEDKDVLRPEDSNLIIENGQELVIDEVHEEYVDYSQETIIQDEFVNENHNVIIENQNEVLERPVEGIQETTIQEDGYETCDVEMEKVKFDDDLQEKPVEGTQETTIQEDGYETCDVKIEKVKFDDDLQKKPVEGTQETTIQEDGYETCDLEIEKVKFDYELQEKPVERTQETTIQEDGIGSVEMERVKLDDELHEDFDDGETKLTFINDNEEFRGFSDTDRDNSEIIKLSEKISAMRKILTSKTETLNNINKSYIAKNNDFSVTNKVGIDKSNSPRVEDRIILKHGLSLEATIKEVKTMSTAIQDLLKKNGKKLFIKIDKLEYELPTKFLVSLQGMETNENGNNQVWQKIQEQVKEECNTGDKTEESQLCNGNETKKEQIVRESSTSSEVIFSSKSNSNGFVEQKNLKQSNSTWEDDDSPCYYFDKSDSKNKKHLTILKDMIGKLEKAVEKQPLQIKNNIPSVKKRGRKRKAQNRENNNSLSAQNKPEPKRRHLSNISKQNEESLCNTSFTLILDVSSNQSFSLPLSPADSDKSDEHKKEEPVTVRTKRTGRVSNSKRYSSEDLYKPRPVLSSSRRRGAKQELHKP